MNKIKHDLLVRAKALYLEYSSSSYICLNIQNSVYGEEYSYGSLLDEISLMIGECSTIEDFLFGKVEMYALPRTDWAYLLMSCSLHRVEIFDKLIAKYAPSPENIM